MPSSVVESTGTVLFLPKSAAVAELLHLPTSNLGFEANRRDARGTPQQNARRRGMNTEDAGLTEARALVALYASACAAAGVVRAAAALLCVSLSALVHNPSA
jgi:hypothetical protein